MCFFFCFKVACLCTYMSRVLTPYAHFFFPFRIKHENIVALEDIYESPNHLYLVMQL